jgi:hypothetical protein
MTARISGLLLAAALAAILFYASRYWPAGFLGLGGGDFIRAWLGGTIWGPFDIVIWGIAGFLFLSLAQALWDRVVR